MKKYINLFLLIFSMSLFSCQQFLEPLPENSISEGQVTKNMAYAEGLLMSGYAALPSDYNFETDIASDDAATNNLASPYKLMATGEWKASNNPIAVWNGAYQQIYYLNKFIDLYGTVVWANDPRLDQPTNDLKNAYYKKRLKGEAFALRAWYKYKLLQYHGGIGTSGTLLGFPIIDKTIGTSDDWKLPRNIYAECVASIFADLDTAVVNLPKTWVDLPTGGTNPPENVYKNLCAGACYENRINGNTAKALKARVALMAASPAFAASSGVTMANAAMIAGSLLSELGTLYTNSASIYNHTFYKEIKNKEIIWNRSQVQSRNWEQNNFPPSLYGNGLVNPTQNLVDAFPMKNGYPITNPLSGYRNKTPYKNRDNRFNEYIVYNTSLLKNTKINTYQGATQNGIDMLTTSTHTGYYLKKFMSENVNLNPSSATNSAHTYTFVRMTELLLNYAEAANEAWGPDVDRSESGYGTARSKIAELRLRAGITAPDPYLASVTTQAGFRNLIKNERRVSLCFEGFRFWDIRRWNDVTAMQTPVQAAYITLAAPDTTYNYSIIEQRNYTQDMIYGPIPFNETRKYNIEQNKGW